MNTSQEEDSISQKKALRHFDLTQGGIISKLLQFSWPLFAANIFQQLYTAVNAIIVGNYLGSEALAAVGVYNPIYNLLLGLFMGVSTGATVVVSQSYGAQDTNRLNHAVHISLILTVITGAAVSILGLVFSPLILRWINTPDEIFDMANSYSKIMFGGMLMVLMYNILCGVLRGMGDSVKPLLFLIFSNVLNVGLDYYSVVILKAGITGAAYATILAQSVAGIGVFIYLLKSQDRYGICLKGLKPDWKIGKELLGIGIPSGLQTSIFSVGYLLQQNLINSFGETVIAAYVVVNRMDQFIMIPMNSFSIAITTFVGQNVGAHKLKRAIQGTREVNLISQGLIMIMTTLLFFAGGSVVRLFTSEQIVVDTAFRILRTLSFGYVTVNSYVVLSGAVRGVGDTVAPLVASMTCNVFLRVPLAYLLVHFSHDYQSIFISIVIAWTLGSIFMITYYRKGIWKRHIHSFDRSSE